MCRTCIQTSAQQDKEHASLSACAHSSSADLLPVLQLMPRAEARLTAGDPVKNARALLRYALPISNEPARRIQVAPAARMPAPHPTLTAPPAPWRKRLVRR
jgi:hypothetical protein